MTNQPILIEELSGTLFEARHPVKRSPKLTLTLTLTLTSLLQTRHIRGKALATVFGDVAKSYPTLLNIELLLLLYTSYLSVAVLGYPRMYSHFHNDCPFFKCKKTCICAFSYGNAENKTRTSAFQIRN